MGTHGTAGTLVTRGSHQTAGVPGVARWQRQPRAGRTSSSSDARGCSGAGVGGLWGQGVTPGKMGGTEYGREGMVGHWWHLQNRSISRMASLAWVEGRWREMGQRWGTAAPPSCAMRSLVSLRCPPHHPHLLGDGGMVVLQDEPLDVVSPHALLLHALGLGGTGRAVGLGRGSQGVPRVPSAACPPTCRLCCCLPCL